MPGVVPLRQRRVALVGTGTGVGKTELGVALLRALGRRLPNLPTAGVKLLETGVAPGASGSDGARLSGAGRTAIGEALVTFPDPLSPHLAARLAGRALTARELAEALDRALRRTWTAARPRQSDTTSDAALLVVIETAGGLFSPISERETNEDLAALVDPSLLILVASDRLGVLHEVAACRRALRSSLQPLLAVVLNRPAQPDQSTGTNAQELERLGLGPVLGVLPEVEGADPAALDAALARLVDAVVG